MPTTSNFGWTTPADTDLVKDGAAAIRTLGNGIDTSFVDLKGGTTDQVLAKNSNTDLDFKWITPNDVDAIQNSIVDAKGDLISATAADTPARLAVGTNGQVLTADNTTATGLKWATPAAGGGMTVIASGTLSGASVTISAISGAYKDLRLVIKNWKPATDNAILYGQLNADTGTNYWTGVGMDTNRSNQTFNSNFIYLASFNDNTVAQGLSQNTFYEYANTTTWKMYEGICVNNHNTTTTNFNALYQNGFYNSISAITEIKIYPDTGNHTSGDYILYGIN